ncbi:hypothetical protein DORFOR_02787 [Dorea formicigenerans ATCC 27755]|uniref:Uncharacterized protein n=1 Tax=Dorea formicigenerans ATCC 27755 TaxID=411461 RepID=B0G925_9FIRM|nr:hypothetical protein DORFOR_02787 [Dorea formicigenerans ATCC 27755]
MNCKSDILKNRQNREADERISGRRSSFLNRKTCGIKIVCYINNTDF